MSLLEFSGKVKISTILKEYPKFDLIKLDSILTKHLQFNLIDFELIGAFKTRMSNYQLAFLYFEEYNLEQKKNDALIKNNQLKGALNDIENGYGKNLNMDNVPKQITPKYIYGYSNDEKQIKCNQIIDRINLLRQKLKKQDEILNTIVNKSSDFLSKIKRPFSIQKRRLAIQKNRLNYIKRLNGRLIL